MKKLVLGLSLFMGLLFLTSCTSTDPKDLLAKFLDSSNYTISDGTNKIVYDNGDMHIKIGESETYVITENEVSSVYLKVLEKWNKVTLDNILAKPVQSMINSFEQVKKDAKKYLDDMDFFEKNEDNQYEGKSDSDYKGILIYVESGKLVISHTSSSNSKIMIECKGKVSLPKEAKE